MRLIPRDRVDPHQPCSRCAAEGSRWDRLVCRPFCPECQEDLAHGRGVPFVQRTVKRPCAACARVGSLPIITFPLGSPNAIEFDLCAEHFRAILGRSLDPLAYRTLRRRLHDRHLTPRNVFLLHEAFYDDLGKALQPVSV